MFEQFVARWSQWLFFWRKIAKCQNSSKRNRKLAFWGWCRHIYAYWLQFSEFLEINSPVKSKSAQGRSPPWLHQEIEKKTQNGVRWTMPRIPEHIVLENVVPKILIECLLDTGHLFQIACCQKWRCTAHRRTWEST